MTVIIPKVTGSIEGVEDDIDCQLCEDGEEGRAPVRMPAPCRPSQKEIRKMSLRIHHSGHGAGIV